MDAEHEKAIATILVMLLFEAPRFDQVYQTSLLLLEGGRDQQVGASLKNMINNWVLFGSKGGVGTVMQSATDVNCYMGIISAIVWFTP